MLWLSVSLLDCSDWKVPLVSPVDSVDDLPVSLLVSAVVSHVTLVAVERDVDVWVTVESDDEYVTLLVSARTAGAVK